MQCSLVFHFFSFKLFVQKETLLRKLEDNVESEMGNWQKIVERTQRELKEVITLLFFPLYTLEMTCRQFLFRKGRVIPFQFEEL